MSEKRVITQRGLYFDELEEGVIYRHQPGRTISEADNILFTTLTMNTQALHLDAAFSETQPFGQRLVNSMLTLSTLVGLSVSQLTQGTIIGQLGLDKVVFPRPVFHGDTLYAESEVLSKRLSESRPGQGIAVFGLIGRNQSGEVVAQAERTVLMKARGSDQDSAGGPSSAGTNADGPSAGTLSAEDEEWKGHS